MLNKTRVRKRRFAQGARVEAQKITTPESRNRWGVRVRHNIEALQNRDPPGKSFKSHPLTTESQGPGISSTDQGIDCYNTGNVQKRRIVLDLSRHKELTAWRTSIARPLGDKY
ncbi:hypothetical protein PM082_021512 [Marasmius tenuissimus]|nr:hypothetical protein PM082_021512 [Marasmius tenuissimus]